MSRSKLVSAPKVIVYINGAPFAQVMSFRYSSETPRHPLYGLDSGEPYELAPLSTKITGSMSVLRLIGDGGAEGAGIVAQIPDLPREKYFSIALIERGSDVQLFRADRCSVVSQNWEVSQRSFMTGVIVFECLSWNNETPSSS